MQYQYGTCVGLVDRRHRIATNAAEGPENSRDSLEWQL